MYIYIYIRGGFTTLERWVRLSILNRRRRRLAVSEAPKTPRGKRVRRDALPI